MRTGKGLSGAVCFSCKINSFLPYLAFPSGTGMYLMYFLHFLYCTFSVQKLLHLFVSVGSLVVALAVLLVKCPGPFYDSCKTTVEGIGERMLIVEFGLEDLEVLLQPRISHKSPLPQTILLSYTCRSVESTGLEKHL